MDTVQLDGASNQWVCGGMEPRACEVVSGKRARPHGDAAVRMSEGSARGHGRHAMDGRTTDTAVSLETVH